MKDYLRLLRVKHYVKNFLIFLPLFFGGSFVEGHQFLIGVLGFVSFSMISSAVYILNDIQDVEKDRQHPKKKNRPIASGAISKSRAMGILMVLVAGSIVISACVGGRHCLALVALYFLLNIAYSKGLKNQPIIDVVILASGFVIRVFYGGFLCNIIISGWLYLVIITGAFYMGLGKRRNELKKYDGTRDVLKYYNVPFLDKNMYVCVALANVFYALWAKDIGDGKMLWTVPVFIVLLMCYSLDIEQDSDGDPIEVILNDQKLIALGSIYLIIIFILIYFVH